ncbi:MAG: Holliday junction resolvase RuvX [Actinomycetota bacterium]
MAFDIGRVRIGVAISDSAGILASPLPFIVRSESDTETVAELIAAVKFHEAVEVYFGLPTSLSGSETKSTEDSKDLAILFADSIDFPVTLIDERLTTVSASNKLRMAGKDSRKSKSLIDSASAVEILEFAMQSERSSGMVQGIPVRRTNGT